MNKVRSWRTATARLSQDKVARRLRISQGMYSRYEQGKIPWPTEIAWMMVELSGGDLCLEDLYPRPAGRRRKAPAAPSLRDVG